MRRASCWPWIGLLGWVACGGDSSSSGEASTDGATETTVGSTASGTATSATEPGTDTSGPTGTSDADESGTSESGGPEVPNPIPPDRLPLPGTWESAGVEGGIPERDTICATVSADATGGADATGAIQAALDACGDGEVVLVPAGTYRIAGTLTVPAGISLRGEGADTELRVESGVAIRIGSLGPWPPPRANVDYSTAVTDGASRGSTTITVGDTSAIEAGNMITVSELDDPDLVWAKSGYSGRMRGSMHMVESTTPDTITFRPALPIDYANEPEVGWYPGVTEMAGVEDIRFTGDGTNPGNFIEITNAWNAWVRGCEFSGMPAKTVIVAWSGHVELRGNYLHDQANGGPNSEALDLLTDVSWSLVVDNISVAGGFPAIVLGDGGAGENYGGGVGNVIAYNYAVDSYYTDPPTSPDHGIMASDISTNHSPHQMYTLVEGNVMSKFASDGYHGSGSHTVLVRNVITGRNSWENATDRIAVQIDRRNLHYSLLGNVLGEVGSPADHRFLEEPISSGLDNAIIFRLGFPDMGNQGFDGTYPPMPLNQGDGGPRDLYVDRLGVGDGTTYIEGNWDSVVGAQDWTIEPVEIPPSMFLSEKPEWFGSLPWPPVDPENPITDDPTIIPAGYRHINGMPP